MELTISYDDLIKLLEDQKELVGEHLVSVSQDLTYNGTVDNARIRNEVRNAAYPKDIYILKKWLKK